MYGQFFNMSQFFLTQTLPRKNIYSVYLLQHYIKSVWLNIQNFDFTSISRTFSQATIKHSFKNWGGHSKEHFMTSKDLKLRKETIRYCICILKGTERGDYGSHMHCKCETVTILVFSRVLLLANSNYHLRYQQSENLHL